MTNRQTDRVSGDRKSLSVLSVYRNSLEIVVNRQIREQKESEYEKTVKLLNLMNKKEKEKGQVQLSEAARQNLERNADE